MTENPDTTRGNYRFETRGTIDLYRDTAPLPGAVIRAVENQGAPASYVGGLREFQVFDSADVETTIESWITFDVRGYPEWRACARYVPDESGELVVAELRIIPKEPSSLQVGDPDGELGEWSRETSAIPVGGLPARALRSIRLREHKRAALLPALAALRDADVAVALPERGLKKASIAAWKKTLEQPDTQERSKGKRRPEIEYAIVCKLYVEQVGLGTRRTNVAVAEQMGEGWDARRVKEVISRCRRYPLHLLTKASMQGVAGGQLTDKARNILKESGHEEAPNGKD